MRLNITLPKKLAQSINRVTGPRKRSAFIADAIKQKIEEKEKKKLENILGEDYRATRKGGFEISKELKAADLEGWDDY